MRAGWRDKLRSSELGVVAGEGLGGGDTLTLSFEEWEKQGQAQLKWGGEPATGEARKSRATEARLG